MFTASSCRTRKQRPTWETILDEVSRQPTREPQDDWPLDDPLPADNQNAGKAVPEPTSVGSLISQLSEPLSPGQSDIQISDHSPRRPEDFLRDPSTGFACDILLRAADQPRPVDYRWQLACKRAFSNFTNRDLDDWGERAAKYICGLRACRDDSDLEQLALLMPDLHAACMLYRHPDKLTWAVVEARLLAGQTVEEVAAACSLTPGAITAYERLYFCVLGKLHAKEYILINAVGPKIWDGLSEDDIDVILKHNAYLHGPGLLDAFIRYYTSGWSVPEQLEGLTRDQLEELHLMLFIRSLILTAVLPFKKCHRVVLLEQLRDELRALINSCPTKAAQPGQGSQVLFPSVQWDHRVGRVATDGASGQSWHAAHRQAGAAGRAGCLKPFLPRMDDGVVSEELNVVWQVQGKNRCYYYRNRRVGGRVLRDYLGNGEEAHLAAALVQQRQLQRQAERQARQVDRQTWDTACEPMARLIGGTDLLFQAALLANGYHQHHQGDWRKRNGNHG